MFTDKFAFYNEAERKTGIVGLTEGITPVPLYGYSVMSLVSELRHENIYGNYLLNCIKTWNQEVPPLYQIPNATLGLIGELAEYFENPTIDEFGDVLYYRAILCWLLGEATEPYMTTKPNEFDFATFTGLTSDFTKKVVYHSKMYDTKTLTKHHKFMTMLDSFLFNELVNVHGLVSFESVFQFNIDKLNKRHQGSGFNPNYDSSNETTNG